MCFVLQYLADQVIGIHAPDSTAGGIRKLFVKGILVRRRRVARTAGRIVLLFVVITLVNIYGFILR